jgi:hypothetical protein
MSFIINYKLQGHLKIIFNVLFIFSISDKKNANTSVYNMYVR